MDAEVCSTGGTIPTGGKHKWEKPLSKCHFIHYKSHMDWPRIDPGSTWWLTASTMARLFSDVSQSVWVTSQSIQVLLVKRAWSGVLPQMLQATPLHTNPSCRICTWLSSASRHASHHPDKLILKQKSLNCLGTLYWTGPRDKKQFRIVSGSMTISGAHAASYFKGTEGYFPEDKPTADWTLPLVTIKYQG
jgi:hypothetical protein